MATLSSAPLKIPYGIALFLFKHTCFPWCRECHQLTAGPLGSLLRPIARALVKLLTFISPNRAASVSDELIIERSSNYLDHIWTGQRSESWYLECLAVHPDHQNRGHGRALVQWGLEQAHKERIACSVIAADGKERFYQACGFNVGPVGRAGEGEGNPLKLVPGGLVFFKEKDGVVREDREPGGWMEGPPGAFDWDEWLNRVEMRRSVRERP